MFCWSPVCQSLLRSENVAFFVKILSCSSDKTSYSVLCVLLLRCVLPRKWPVYRIGSNITSLCGVVCFATCLTGWVGSSRFSVKFIIVEAKVVCVTVEISGIIFVVSNLLLCVTVFIWVSSGDSKLFGSDFLKRCVTICTYVPFYMWAWFIKFFRCGSILAYLNCSIIARATTPNASIENFWSPSKKLIKFWFAGLNTSCWNLCFPVAIDWGFTYFLRNTVKNSTRFSPFHLLMFLNIRSASPRMREWKSLFCLLLWADFGFSISFGIDLQTVQISLISRWTWALLSWGT